MGDAPKPVGPAIQLDHSLLVSSQPVEVLLLRNESTKGEEMQPLDTQPGITSKNRKKLIPTKITYAFGILSVKPKQEVSVGRRFLGVSSKGIIAEDEARWVTPLSP